jgi:hypothetical protein
MLIFIRRSLQVRHSIRQYQIPRYTLPAKE